MRRMCNDPVSFFKCLADSTRLHILLLLAVEGELCVCELSSALAASQPKISRHLAQLRDGQLLDQRRDGQWIYYRLHDALPAWMATVINSAAGNNAAFIQPCRHRLATMGDRPQRQKTCC